MDEQVILELVEAKIEVGENVEYWRGVREGLRWHTFGDDIKGLD